jgi:hypothetical protein
MAPLILTLGARWGWVVNWTPLSLSVHFGKEKNVLTSVRV